MFMNIICDLRPMIHADYSTQSESLLANAVYYLKNPGISKDILHLAYNLIEIQ